MKEIREEIRALKMQGITPGIATLLIGSDYGSRMYRGQVEKLCKEAGFNYINENPAATIDGAGVVGLVDRLNRDPAVSGILPLRPFPEHIPADTVIDSIDPQKDIDCFHPYNMGRLALGEPIFSPATPSAVIEILERYAREIAEEDPAEFFRGAEIVVVGRSNTVGKPIALLALNRSATISITHSFTFRKNNLAKHTSGADILIVAAGKPNLIGADLVKEGAIVIDVGINWVKVLDEEGKPILNEKGRFKTRTVGDVSFEEVKEKAGAITPVPGGVGSVTVRMLLKNALKACKIQHDLG